MTRKWWLYHATHKLLFANEYAVYGIVRLISIFLLFLALSSYTWSLCPKLPMSGPFKDLDLYPEALRSQIDAVNDWVYPSINDGVYKCGFAKSQSAYDEAVTQLYEGLDRVEGVLDKSRYLVGNELTEADIRLFMTLVRFDEVYVVYFKCNVKRLADYPNIRNYMRDIYQLPGFSSCINMEQIKMHYYT